jgi:hypothetical protein
MVLTDLAQDKIQRKALENTVMNDWGFIKCSETLSNSTNGE